MLKIDRMAQFIIQIENSDVVIEIEKVRIGVFSSWLQTRGNFLD